MKSGFKGVQNTSGRPKGSLNVATAEIREKFSQLIENNIDQLQKDIESLHPSQRVKVIIELARFIVPTLKSTDLYVNESNDDFNEITINLIQATADGTN
jgi:hypothetical protein